MQGRRIAGLAVAAVAGALAATVVGAAPAAAHVTVNPGDATQGGFTKLAFRVPNEKDGATTVKVEVNLPADTPIPSVSVKPTPGWTVQIATTRLATPLKTDDGEVTEATSKITWTAANAGAAIQPGQFQEFEVSAGPLPKVDQLVFKALQTYSDKDVVHWIEEPSGGTEPEHPAPVLKLAAAKAAVPAATQVAPGPLTTGASSDGTARWLGVAGLVAGLAGLIAGLLAWRRTPSRS
jgi:uncharacterized protein YcnI